MIVVKTRLTERPAAISHDEHGQRLLSIQQRAHSDETSLQANVPHRPGD